MTESAGDRRLLTRLLFVRHGEAHVNLVRSGNAVKDTEGLTEHGRAQAEALRDRLLAGADGRPDVIVSSTFPRARQTAGIVAEGLAMDVTEDDDLQEWRIGEQDDAEHLTIEQLEQHWLRTETGLALFERLTPSTESYAEFGTRVGATVHALLEQHRGRMVLVFSHGGVIDVTMAGLASQTWVVPPSAIFRTRHASITEWQHLEDGDAPPVWLLRRYNDDHHLTALNQR